jgi:hypothetical protein
MRPVLALLLAVGCIDGPGRDDAPMGASYDDFVERVQPILEASCGNPACHGAPERPLQVFGVHQHRLNPDEVWVDAPLSGQELALNFLRSCAFLLDIDEPESCRLLAKPLAESEGGIRHGGGVVFERTDDPDYLALLDWVEAALPEEAP